MSRQKLLMGVGVVQHVWLRCRYTLEELAGFVEEAEKCIPGTTEAIEAAFDREANPVWQWGPCIKFSHHTGIDVWWSRNVYWWSCAWRMLLMWA